MITTTNNVEQFIEKIDAPLFIYGVGRVGYIVADFMSKTGTIFNGFIDKAAEGECYQKIGGGILPHLWIKRIRPKIE